MTDKHHVTIDRARREAKKIARSSDLSYQQALDQIACQAGYRHWSEMLGASAAPRTDEAELTRTTGRKISAWIGGRLQDAAAKALQRETGSSRAIRPIPLNARTVAQAIDPLGGPFLSETIARAHCPLHDPQNTSLRITGDGAKITLRCAEGCDPLELQDLALKGLADAAAATVAFMRANDRSAIIAGGTIERGGKGGTYLLEDGTQHRLNVLTCRMLPDGYPRWIHHGEDAGEKTG